MKRKVPPAEAILEFIKRATVRTPTEIDAFDWAYGPTLAMAQLEENAGEIEAAGGLFAYIRADLVERLGEQLSSMTEDQVGETTYRKDLAYARVARKLAEKIEAMKEGPTQ